MLQFDLFPSDTLHLFLFTDVENANDVLQRLLKGDVELAFITPTMVQYFALVGHFSSIVSDSKRISNYYGRHKGTRCFQTRELADQKHPLRVGPQLKR